MKYFMVNGELLTFSQMLERRDIGTRSSLPAPMIIRDTLDDVKNPVDGKIYDSKSAYYQAVKAAGCEIVGNEAEKMMDRPAPRSDVSRDDIDAALHKMKQGYKPAPLETTKWLPDGSAGIWGHFDD